MQYIQRGIMSQGSLPDRKTLNIHDAACLAPFYAAQRPHGDTMTWRQMRAAGHKPVPKEDPSLKFVCDRFNATYTDNEVVLDYDKIVRAKKKKVESDK
tara:strand:- start:1805 stop:2098 length:294 start_codon:yes stop_codon:yes gene_type:complete